MLSVNLKLAFRNIVRNKLYTTINVVGLSVACAFCILVYWYVQNERSFDRFHNNVDNLYRFEETNTFETAKPQKSFFSFLMKDDEQKNNIQTPLALAGEIKRDFPEVESAVRLSHFQPVIRAGNQSFKEDYTHFVYADKDFFRIFNFPLLYGNAASVLANPNQAVISERLAEKYFGGTNVVGKVLTVQLYGKSIPITISGVAENFPPNSSFQFDMVLPIDENSANYIKLFKEASFNDPLFIRFKQASFHIYIRPFANAHYNQSEGWGHYTNVKNIYELVTLAIVILIIACLNYVLLTLTSALSRSQDVGVRKTIGAGRWQIIKQYYTETQLLAFVSVIIGLLMAVTFLPFFNSLTGADLQFGYFSFTQVIITLIALALFLGLIAGIYPALTMSGLRPLSTMRSFSAYKLNPVLSRFLVVVQFTICVVLVISSLVMNKQMRFISKTDMGFDKDKVMIFNAPYYDDKKNILFKTQLAQFVAETPALDGITTTNTDGYGEYNTRPFTLGGVSQQVQAIDIDYNYFAFNKILIIKGRNFSKEIATDTAQLNLPASETTVGNSVTDHAVVVNETLYNMLQRPELGIVNRDLGGVIIGVCRDYHTNDLTQKISPLYHTMNDQQISSYWIRVKAGQSLPLAMENIQANWEKLTNGMPFDYTFLDEDVAKSYDAYLQWMNTINTSCILAIIIACLGLFGLSGLTTINRTKEIGIRKVLGASVTNLFLLLNKGTFVLAICSFIIAVPVAWYFSREWLENFAYRIQPGWMLFAAAGIIAIITAGMAVSYHAVKAAVANPVESLRSE
jgi:putative ABC transport system permease protein